MQVNRPWVYSCAGCSSSKEDVNENVGEFTAKRPKAPAAPPRITKVVTIQVEVKQSPKYPVYAFDMWMWFDKYSAYLDWQDRLRYGK